MAKRGFGGGMMPGNMNNHIKASSKDARKYAKNAGGIRSKGDRVFSWWRSCYCKG